MGNIKGLDRGDTVKQATTGLQVNHGKRLHVVWAAFHYIEKANRFLGCYDMHLDLEKL